MARLAKHPIIESMPSPDADDATRIRWLKQDYWLSIESTDAIIEKMQELLDDPPVVRMPNLAIIGAPFSGKTTLLKKFVKSANPTPDPTAHQTDLPVLMIDSPPAPSESRLYSALLDKLGMSGPTREPAEIKLRRLKDTLSDLEVRMILLDEFNRSVGRRGGGTDTLMSAIREIGNALEINFVVAGTDAVCGVIASDAQTHSRFRVMRMKDWKFGEDTFELVKKISGLLPLRGTLNINGDKALMNLVSISEGMLGEIVDIVRLLAKDAIKNKSESIGHKQITKINLSRLGYRSPSVRALD